MSIPLSSLFALYTLTPGRRIYALTGVQKLAQGPDYSDLLKLIQLAIAHDREALELDAARRAQKLTKSPPVRIKDRAVDRTLLTIHRLLSHFAETPVEPPIASDLLSNLFPVSVNHHIRLTFVEQSAANERVLSVLESKPHQAWLDAHGLRPLIVELRTNHEAFMAALAQRDAPSGPNWDEVQAAQVAGQELYLQVVAAIIVRCTDDQTARAALLQPILDQDQAVQAYRRQRRRPVDIDPDSGEPVAEDNEDDETDDDAPDEVSDESPAAA